MVTQVAYHEDFECNDTDISMFDSQHSVSHCKKTSLVYLDACIFSMIWPFLIDVINNKLSLFKRKWHMLLSEFINIVCNLLLCLVTWISFIHLWSLYPQIWNRDMKRIIFVFSREAQSQSVCSWTLAWSQEQVGTQQAAICTARMNIIQCVTVTI